MRSYGSLLNNSCRTESHTPSLDGKPFLIRRWLIDQQTAVSYIKGQELYNPKGCFIRPVLNKSVKEPL